MLFLLKWFDCRGGILIINPAFAPVPVDIGQLVDSECVLLVEGGKIELADGRSSLRSGRILDKGES